MYRTSVLAIAVAFLTGTAAFAQFPPQPPSVQQGTEQERAACHPDVVKYCQAELTANQDDAFAILGCLQKNRTRISAACGQVLNAHGQ